MRFGGLDPPSASLSLALPYLTFTMTLYTATIYRSNNGCSETISELLKATLLALGYLC